MRYSAAPSIKSAVSTTSDNTITLPRRVTARAFLANLWICMALPSPQDSVAQRHRAARGVQDHGAKGVAPLDGQREADRLAVDRDHQARLVVEAVAVVVLAVARDLALEGAAHARAQHLR